MHETTVTVPHPPASHPVRVDASGRVVIPAAVRDRLGVRPGDELILQEAGGGIDLP